MGSILLNDPEISNVDLRFCTVISIESGPICIYDITGLGFWLKEKITTRSM